MRVKTSVGPRKTHPIAISTYSLWRFRNENLRDIDLISIGQESFEGAIQIENGLNIKPVIKNAAQSLGVTAQDMASLVVPEFFPIGNSPNPLICEVPTPRSTPLSKLGIVSKCSAVR